jgi:hypothetical protein
MLKGESTDSSRANDSSSTSSTSLVAGGKVEANGGNDGDNLKIAIAQLEHEKEYLETSLTERENSLASSVRHAEALSGRHI